MPLLSKTNLLAGGLALMVVINIIILAVLWFGQPSPPISNQWRSPSVSGPTTPHFIERQLQLSDQQKRQFHQLHQTHRQQMQTLRSEAFETRRQLLHLIQQQRGDQSGAAIRDSLITRISSLHTRMETSMFDHIAGIRSICTEDQLPRFNRIIDQLARRISPGPPHGPGRQHRGFRRQP